MPAKKRKERKAPTKITNRKQRRVEAKVTEKYETEKEEEIVREGEKRKGRKMYNKRRRKKRKGIDASSGGGRGTRRRKHHRSRDLRLPRYFDDDFEAAAMRCFRCGKGGHREFECTLPRSKLCHLCGDFDHQARDCPKGLCFNCLTLSSIERLPREERNWKRAAVIVLLEMWEVWARRRKVHVYVFEADLKQMQCYVRRVWALVLRQQQDSQPPGKLSCVKCGGEGHVESTCRHSNFRRSPGVFECFNCGGPHLARECPNSRLSGGVGSRYSSSHLGVIGGGGWGGMGSNGNNRNNSMSRMGSVGGTYTNGGGGGNFSAGRVGRDSRPMSCQDFKGCLSTRRHHCWVGTVN